MGGVNEGPDTCPMTVSLPSHHPPWFTVEGCKHLLANKQERNGCLPGRSPSLTEGITQPCLEATCSGLTLCRGAKMDHLAQGPPRAAHTAKKARHPHLSEHGFPTHAL